MQNKKTMIVLGILVLLVGAAAFIGGQMLNGTGNPLGLGRLMGGDGGMMSVSVQVTPAPELPTTRPEVTGSFVERKDNSIVVATVSMEKGAGGGVVLSTSSDGGDGGQEFSGPPKDGPQVEVVITNETTIYLETTVPPEPSASGEEVVLQQTVEEGSLDDLTDQSFVTVWGRKSGDRVVAEVVFISNPVLFKRPGP
jgi:hypothetical protein